VGGISQKNQVFLAGMNGIILNVRWVNVLHTVLTSWVIISHRIFSYVNAYITTNQQTRLVS
jgi:hypothetical protein